MASDLSALDDLVAGQDRGLPVTIKHPVTGEPLDITFIVAGPDSDTARRARLKMQDELYAFQDNPPASEIDRLQIERLARCVVGWSIKKDGVDVPFTFTAAVRILREMQFVREQVEQFAASRAAWFLNLPFESEK